jgi:acetyl esterase/lipase
VLRHGAYDLGGTAPDPTLHPLDAELGGLPPTLLLAGLQDPLLDETRLLARRMAEAGCVVELILLPEDPRTGRGRLATRTTAFIRAWLETR